MRIGLFVPSKAWPKIARFSLFGTRVNTRPRIYRTITRRWITMVKADLNPPFDVHFNTDLSG